MDIDCRVTNSYMKYLQLLYLVLVEACESCCGEVVASLEKSVVRNVATDRAFPSILQIILQVVAHSRWLINFLLLLLLLKKHSFLHSSNLISLYSYDFLMASPGQAPASPLLLDINGSTTSLVRLYHGR